MVLRILLIWALLFGFTAGQPQCAEQTAAPEQMAAEPAPPSFPDLSELGSRSAALADFVVKSKEQLQQLADLTDQKKALSDLQDHFNQLEEEIKQLGPPGDWYVDRLYYYLNLFSQIRKDLDDLQQQLADRRQQFESIRAQAVADREFWKNWAEHLQKQEIKIPRKTIDLVQKQLSQLQDLLKNAETPLVHLQEKQGSLQQALVLTTDRLSSALDKLRKATFRKNAFTFFSTDFYRQFGDNLLKQITEGTVSAFNFNGRYLADNAWVLILIVTGSAFLGLLLRHRRKLFPQKDEIPFILQRPAAVSAFFFVTLSWLLLPEPPALLRFSLSILSIASAISLALTLMESRRQMRVLLLAAVVFLLTNFFRLIALPQPVFRVYIATLAIILVPLLIRQVRISRARCEAGQGRLFRGLLRLAIIVLIFSLVTQLTGYMNFSAWLMQATLETGVVFLFVHITGRLLIGGIDLGIQLLEQSRQAFFQDFGGELGRRLKRLGLFLIYGFTFFYLLPVWRLFATINDGWEYFSELSISVGEVKLTIVMLGSALLALYLAFQVSWILQAITETEVLRKRHADRGVQDAVKKLIHYAIVLIGFMLALSMLGFGLQNFVVLLGAFGVGIGFGLQDIVNNFLSGLILLFERPIKVGDGVLIDGEYGTVIRIGMRSTVVQNLDEAELIVPNSQMISQKVTNWTLSNRRVRIAIPVGVAYGSDLETVLEILSETGRHHPEVLETPKPTPLFVQFGASSLDFELRVWISNVDHRPRIINELLLYIDKRFREAGIEIPFSQHDLHIRSVSPGVFPEQAEK